MNIIILFFAILLLLIIIWDFFITVLSISGAGFVSSMISALISTVFLKLSRLLKNREVLNYSGVSVILSLIIWWIGGLWLGFFLLLVSDSDSVVNTSTHEMASISDKFYYSGYVLSTMGNGDFKPGSSTWQIVIAFFPFSGFIFITTAMTYLISVSSAVIFKRSLAHSITDIMGLDNYDERINCLYENTDNIRNRINQHNQNHLAYPVVHYFYSLDKKASFSVGLWELNAMLTSLQNDPTQPLNKLKPLNQAIDNYLSSMGEAFIPKVQSNSENEGEDSVKKRRKQLQNLLKSDGWHLNQIEMY
ncbi:potassium channel family protein [Cyclobacterium marinum]|uniref:Ion transport 2 domain protein n=1 Tax=Cyclobacterium marinum (strain ATCC 25205 / DSM 745 / LMG 13164 / NCIMB 1802) TaxID=880070 RepID=G0J1Q9_CYCMS|nr:potassium channel family protein [Cyclobacterium marinum]AEL28268.1 Ion transport 2 domain protein [Cyclobacterium marinum DSM 745]|tara:strand:+ start:952 stop:1863 length:912 start_codon:yes stop_codon:yes gene_type:complete